MPWRSALVKSEQQQCTGSAQVKSNAVCGDWSKRVWNSGGCDDKWRSWDEGTWESWEDYGHGQKERQPEDEKAWQSGWQPTREPSWQETEPWLSQPSACGSIQGAPVLVLRPPSLPRGDNRLAPNKRDEKDLRVYVCDNCGTSCGFYLRSMPFDGQYVNYFVVRGYPAETLKAMYLRGEVDVTWHCTRCHARLEEKDDLNRTRSRIGVMDFDRMERTMGLAKSGFQPTWPTWRR